jgi:hypothetical protein
VSCNSYRADRKHNKRMPRERKVSWAAAAIMAMSVTTAVMMAGGAAAQTLTTAKPKTDPMPAPGTTESHAGDRSNACGSFGAGFVQLPGTDACVKVGGTVTVEGTSHGN